MRHEPLESSRRDDSNEYRLVYAAGRPGRIPKKKSTLGAVNWLRGRSLWYPTFTCNYVHSAEFTLKLQRDLAGLGHIDQVQAITIYAIIIQAITIQVATWRDWATSTRHMPRTLLIEAGNFNAVTQSESVRACV